MQGLGIFIFSSRELRLSSLPWAIERYQ